MVLSLRRVSGTDSTDNASNRFSINASNRAWLPCNYLCDIRWSYHKSLSSMDATIYISLLPPWFSSSLRPSSMLESSLVTHIRRLTLALYFENFSIFIQLPWTYADVKIWALAFDNALCIQWLSHGRLQVKSWKLSTLQVHCMKIYSWVSMCLEKACPLTISYENLTSLVFVFQWESLLLLCLKYSFSPFLDLHFFLVLSCTCVLAYLQTRQSTNYLCQLSILDGTSSVWKRRSSDFMSRCAWRASNLFFPRSMWRTVSFVHICISA